MSYWNDSGFNPQACTSKIYGCMGPALRKGYLMQKKALKGVLERCLIKNDSGLFMCISFNYFHHSFFWSFSSNALAPKLCFKSSILWKVHQFRNRCMRANVFKRFLIKSGILQPLPAKFVFKRNFKFENAGFFIRHFLKKLA